MPSRKLKPFLNLFCLACGNTRNPPAVGAETQTFRGDNEQFEVGSSMFRGRLEHFEVDSSMVQGGHEQLDATANHARVLPELFVSTLNHT